MVFIDGFNLYHAIDNDFRLRQYKWLDVVALAKSLIKPHEQLIETIFFTTIVTWDAEKQVRHRTYIDALQIKGARIIYGEFHKKDVHCKKCGAIFQKYEEKQTDVNIAVELLKQAHADAFDTAIVLSGDSDLIAALRLVRDIYPQKKIAIAIPPGRRAEQLKSVVHFHLKIRAEQIKENQLPATISLPDGNKIISPYQSTV